MDGDRFQHEVLRPIRKCKNVKGVWYVVHDPEIGVVGDMVTGITCRMDHPMHEVERDELSGAPTGIGKMVLDDGAHEWSPAQDFEPTMKWNIDAGGVHMEWSDGKGLEVEPVTDDARYILEQLPTIMREFLENNAKYARAQTGHDLGYKGIIPDINRKFGVLVSRIWHGEPDAGRDSTHEIIGDMIGHLLLLLAKRRESSPYEGMPDHHPYEGSV